jgi:hypothetical protein
MASGHVNRANKAEHMAAPHRYLRREDFPCQFGAVHTWPIPVFNTRTLSVGYQMKSGRALRQGKQERVERGPSKHIHFSFGPPSGMTAWRKMSLPRSRCSAQNS